MLRYSGTHPPKKNRRQVMRSTCESRAWLPHGSELAIVWQQKRGPGCRWTSFHLHQGFPGRWHLISTTGIQGHSVQRKCFWLWFSLSDIRDLGEAEAASKDQLGQPVLGGRYCPRYSDWLCKGIRNAETVLGISGELHAWVPQHLPHSHQARDSSLRLTSQQMGIFFLSSLGPLAPGCILL